MLRAVIAPLRMLAEKSETKWDNRAVEMLSKVLGKLDDANPVRVPMEKRK